MSVTRLTLLSVLEHVELLHQMSRTRHTVCACVRSAGVSATAWYLARTPLLLLFLTFLKCMHNMASCLCGMAGNTWLQPRHTE